MTEYKLFVQRIGLVGITNILLGLSSIILIPILTKTLGATDYGLWIQISTTITLVTNFTPLGLPYAMVIYLSPLKDKEKIKEGFYSIIFTVLALSVIIALIMLIFSPYIASSILDGNLTLGILLAVIVFVASLNAVLINYFRTFQAMKMYSLFLLTQTYLGLILASYLALSGMGIVYVVLGLLSSYLVIFLLMSGAILRDIGFKIPKFTDIREYLTFSLPTIPSNLSYWVVNSSDRYVIGIILGAAYVGYYSPGYSLAGIITMMIAPFSLLLPAVLPKYHEKDEVNEMRKFLKYSMKYFLLAAIPCGVGLSLLSLPILMLLTTPDIALQGFMVTPLVVLSTLLFGIYAIVSNIIVLNKKTKIIGFIWILAAIINLGLTIYLVPLWGIMGAATATVVAFAVAFILTLKYSLKLFTFDFDLRSLLKSLVAAAGMGVFLIFFPSEGLLNLILAIIISAIIYFALILLLKGINKEEWDFFKSILSRS